jgi:hypothetical protein
MKTELDLTFVAILVAILLAAALSFTATVSSNTQK